MDSPNHEEFSTPPSTPHANLTPSLSRKTSRPSSLRIESKSADYRPDIVLTEEALSPEAATKTKSPETATTKGIPTPRAAHSPLPPQTQARLASRAQHLAQNHDVPPKSPYFVHSHLDRGVSLTDWLRTNGPRPMNGHELNGIDIGTEPNGSAEDEVFERDDEDEDHSQISLTKQLAETAAGVRKMSKQLGT
jgi:NAD+ kinase